jgi:hypothetical protein
MNAARAAESLEQFCAESHRVRALPDLGHVTHDRDAAMYLAVRVDWENGQLGLLHLAEPLLARMSSPERNWRFFTAADYAGLDFSWLTALADYDHWSIATDGPLKNAQTIDFFTSPQPDFSSLQQWAKLRLIKGKNEGDLARASAEVRHLADLCASTETMNGEFQRTAMHAIERAVWELAALEPPTPLPTEDEANAYRALVVAGAYFLLPGVSDEVRERALDCAPSRCASISEAIGATAAMADLEPGAARSLRWLRDQHGCHSSWLDRVSEKGNPQVIRELLENPTAGVDRALALIDGGVFPR